MTNGVRHVLGIVAGLLLPPLIAAGLIYGVAELTVTVQRASAFSWTGAGLLVASGVALAFLAGSRLSPVASLLGGLMFALLGSLPLLEVLSGLRILPQNILPGLLDVGFRGLAYQGILLAIGVMLIVASLFPSRWRARPALGAPAPGPYHPSGQQGGSDPYPRGPYSPGPYVSDARPSTDVWQPSESRPSSDPRQRPDVWQPSDPRPPSDGRHEDTTRPMHRE
ncbi:hypothetical protein [Nonomuraea sp. LPB2021202275-12-8]|uniref:hypothetical protein n=1 Tax=Nonomuraea sp. LPB2021202275-12-8 TaxID=3120159 RepID=UPI00300C00A4